MCVIGTFCVNSKIETTCKNNDYVEKHKWFSYFIRTAVSMKSIVVWYYKTRYIPYLNGYVNDDDIYEVWGTVRAESIFISAWNILM